jgi:hypothetical protein
MFQNLWSGLGASSTKFAFVVGILTILSQAMISIPFRTPNAMAQLVATVLAVAMSVYTVYCMNTGGCNRFAWFTMLLPLILLILLMLTNMISLPMSAYGSSPAWQSIWINPAGQPIMERSTCDVHVQDQNTMRAVPITTVSEIDFYSKNQFHDYYDGAAKYKDNYWQRPNAGA